MGNYRRNDWRSEFAKKVFTRIATKRDERVKEQTFKQVVLCKRFGISKQALHKRVNKIAKDQGEHKVVLDLVKIIRYQMHACGTEKVYDLIKTDLKEMKIKMGRCKLNSLLRENGMLVKKRKKFVFTTNSRHKFRKYSNLIKDMKITKPEQVWVADITYIRTKKDFVYLHLITDAYSKQIMGFALSDNLKAESTLKAFKMALKARRYPKRKLIHHSDRGIQYCCDEYTNYLKKNKIQISMTQNSDPYENAIAERVNGILKHEFSLSEVFVNIDEAIKETKNGIFIYNNKRPHRSCKMLIPVIAHIKGRYILPKYKSSRFTNFENNEQNNKGKKVNHF